MAVFQLFRTVSRTPLRYILGRFRFVRWVYARRNRLQNKLNGKKLPKSEGLPESPIVYKDVKTAVAELRKTALTHCIRLSPSMVEEIVKFARQAECKTTGVDKIFRYKDVEKGRLADGISVALTHCQKSTECQAVCKVRDDSRIQSIVANYLGYVPTSAEIWLYWSFAGDIRDSDRRSMYQTIDYHYDVHDYNFCYVHIYLTDTDVNSGAHVMVLGSHKSKPIRWLFGSARQTDEAIERHYGKEKILCLEGKAGTGFIEDTSCYHKALAPVSRDRLLLQIRYH